MLLKPYLFETTKKVEEYLKSSINSWNYQRLEKVELLKEINSLFIRYDKSRIEEDAYQVVHINSDTDMYFGNIMFKNEADAKYVIDNPNFKDILDKIFKD